MAYNKPSWMTWEDQGGSLFGEKDVTKALNMGVSYADIQSAVRESDAIARSAGSSSGQGQYGGRFNTSSNLQSAYESAKSGRLDSSVGDTAFTGGADIALYSQARGGMSGKVAQEIRDQANYNPNLQIGGAMSNLKLGIGSYAAGQDAADSAAAAQRAAQQQAAETRAWQQDQANQRAREAEARLRQMQDAEAARAAEALKVRTSRSTAVGAGQSAGGIKIAQSPAFASGAASRGTAQLARSDKGTQLKTLNV